MTPCNVKGLPVMPTKTLSGHYFGSPAEKNEEFEPLLLSALWAAAPSVQAHTRQLNTTCVKWQRDDVKEV